jgi:rod shape-determining protein MreD
MNVLVPPLLVIAPTLAALLSILPLTAPVAPQVPLMPMLPLLFVGVWALYQPALMPPAAALLVGLATDAALGQPLGVHATLMPAAALGLRLAHPFVQRAPFWLDWTLALGALLLYALAAAGLLALAGVQMEAWMALPQALTTWLMFPAVARLSSLAFRRVAGPAA